MAGLAAAAALARRFNRVTVVERDTFPSVGGHRRGVPQGRHGHALLPAGLDALTELFPGIVTDLCAKGARIGDPTALRFYIAGGRIFPVDHGRLVVAGTRPLVEGVVRERVRGLPSVRFVEACDARGLVTSADRARVTGVRVLPRADSSAERVLPAELVVDATGRGSRSPRWLADLGYPAPDEERIHVDLHYATRLFRRASVPVDDATQILVVPEPGQRRGAFAQAVEDGRWLVTLIGALGERPPVDLDGFVDYAGSLWVPDVHRLVTAAEPLGDGWVTTYPASTRRRYDRLRAVPDGYVVTGDALCSFNPVYGQGMSVAAAEACALGQVLDRHGLHGVGQRFFRKAKRVVDVAWTLATDSDLADPDVEGSRTVRWRTVNGYLRRLLPVAHRDPVVAMAFLEVVGMVAPPESLMHPRILWRVAAAGSGPPTGGDPVPTDAGGNTLPV